MQDTDATRGLSQRELLLEVRQDVKDMRGKMDARPTRAEVYGSLAALSVMIGVYARIV